MRLTGKKTEYGVEIEVDDSEILEKVATMAMRKAGMYAHYWIDQGGALRGDDISYHGSPCYETIKKQATEEEKKAYELAQAIRKLGKK